MHLSGIPIATTSNMRKKKSSAYQFNPTHQQQGEQTHAF
ncbi:hypothetical protein CHISP_1060 [Chitinispirillum alkaliphilum]|nr:hypothetical protein CHISP_1060 [Chitinispirillum alkaliphilum]